MKKGIFTMAAILALSASAQNDPEAFAKKNESFFKSFPPGIKTVAVITAASVPDKKTIEEAIGVLRKNGIKVKTGKNLYTPEKIPGKRKNSYSQPPLADRREDFMNAWMDPEVDLVISTRGGSGAQDLIKVLDWEAMKKFPDKKLIGFSNITCITGAMLRKGIGHPYAGPNLGSLYGASDGAQESFRLAMSGKAQKPFKLKTIRPGDCSGKIYAGHLVLLTVVDSLPEFKVDPAGRIVFVECVGRKPDVLMKYWKQLVGSGFFKNVKGVVFAHFTKTGLRKKGIDSMLAKFAEDLNCPVYSGFFYGHLPDNYSLDFFATASIKDGVLTITPEKKK